MKPSRELDALVAEKVMGMSTERRLRDIPEYSTDVAAAWQVVEKLKWAEPELSWSDEQHAWCLYLNKKPLDIWQPEWSGGCLYLKKTLVIWPTAPTAPHAICLAALRAVGVEV